MNNCEQVVNKNEETFLYSFLEERHKRYSRRHSLRHENSNPAVYRAQDSRLVNLDYSAKRRKELLNKMKTNISTLDVFHFMNEIYKFNLTKNTEEVAEAVLDIDLKLKDVFTAVLICHRLHLRHDNFADDLFRCFQKTLLIDAEGKIVNSNKLTVGLSFYADLVAVGLFNDEIALALLGDVLRTLIKADKDKHLNCLTLLNFCQHCGEHYARLVPRKIKQLATKYNCPIDEYDLFLSFEKQDKVKYLLRNYYVSLCKHLLRIDEEIQNIKSPEMQSEFTDEINDKLECLQCTFKQLLEFARSFSDILDEDMPSLKTEITNK